MIACALALAGAPARAAEPGGKSVLFAPERMEAPSALSELRLGAFAHDPWSRERGSVDVNGEFVLKKVFRAPDPKLDFFVPRFHVGGSLNTAGRTSNAYAGLTWTLDLTRDVFVEFAFGGAVNNGSPQAAPFARHINVGCRQSFREAGSLGWRMGGGWSLIGTVEHYSNAGLCGRNRGVTNFGARLGYSF